MGLRHGQRGLPGQRSLTRSLELRGPRCARGDAAEQVKRRPPRAVHREAAGHDRFRGLEYLFGVADRDGNYNGSWALDPAGERRAFERFIDDVQNKVLRESLARLAGSREDVAFEVEEHIAVRRLGQRREPLAGLDPA